MEYEQEMTTILIIDDEYLIAEILSFALEDEGFLTVTEASGRKALDILARERPDLIITDYMMPGMTGLEFAETVKAREQFSQVPIMLMSGAQAYMGVGRPDLFVHVLEKPFEIDAVVKLVQSLLLGHDLRSPLGAVLLASERLRTKPTLETADIALANQIWTSVNRASSMVNDLLDLARSNLGSGIPLALDKVELNGICESVVEEIQTGHPKASIHFDGGAVIIGQFDAARVAQVFSNLIGNAVRHGDIHQPIYVTLTDNGLTATFSVQNRGELIPESAMPYLFNPEGRYSVYADQERGPSAGLGLGLFIASQIVEGHGGRIEVVSTEEAGTVCRAYLPIT